MLITIKNDYHNTSASVRVESLPAILSRQQMYRVQRKLCGIAGCACGGDISERGQQDVSIDPAGYGEYGPIVRLSSITTG